MVQSRIPAQRPAAAGPIRAAAAANPKSSRAASQLPAVSGKAKLPTHIEVAAASSGLPKDSVILLEQVRTLDKRRLRERMGRADRSVMEQVDEAIAVSFGLSRSNLA